MKSLILTLSYILLCLSPVLAQLKVDAGNDVIVCCCANLDEREETMEIGGDTVAIGGAEPYTYTWSSKTYGYQYPHLYPKWIYASDMLDDTTKSNPTFKKGYLPEGGNISFHLKVEDAGGNVQYDSVVIVQSTFIIHTILIRPKTIIKGDSIKLIADPYFVSLPFPIVGYMLSPSCGLTDSTDIYGWAKPDTSTTYYLQAVNSAGCVSSKIEYWHIEVIDTANVSNNIVNNPEIKCFLNGGSLVVNKSSYNDKPYSLTVTTLNGQIIHSGEYREKNLRLSNLSMQPKQMYILTILEDDKRFVVKLINN